MVRVVVNLRGNILLLLYIFMQGDGEGAVYEATRTEFGLDIDLDSHIWTYSLHRDRLKLLGRWRNFSKK